MYGTPDVDRAGQAIPSGRDEQDAAVRGRRGLVDGGLQRAGVVGHAVAARAEFLRCEIDRRRIVQPGGDH
jgi:hypothetical protein